MSTNRRRGRGEGTIRRRKDGRWEWRIDLGWHNGKRVRKSIFARTQKEVIERGRAFLRQHGDGAAIHDERLRVGDYLDWWLDEVIVDRVRPSTAISYGEKVRLHLKPHLGHVRLSKLSAADVHAFMRAKLAAGMTPRGVAYCRAVLRKALNDAMALGLVHRNVATLVEPPKAERVEVVPLGPHEAKALLAAARGDRLYAVYAVALAVGLRLGEALGLHWDDVDLDAGTLRVRHSLQRLQGELRLVEPKSAKSRRTVSLPASCVDALRGHRHQQNKERLAADNWVEHGLVFTTTVGTPIDPRNLDRHFERLCHRAGIGKRRFHDLRHTCASLLLAQNVHPRVVMETLGHSQISLTMDTYSHVLPAVQRDAAERIDEVLKHW